MTHDVAVYDRPLVDSVPSAPANLAPLDINRNEVIRHLLRVRVGPQGEEHVGDEGLVAREQDRGGGLLLREATGEMPRRERAGPEPGEAGVQVEVCARVLSVSSKGDQAEWSHNTDQGAQSATDGVRGG